MVFKGADCVLARIKNINGIISGEQAKAKAAYQEALTATFSHEQNTPLNSILNLASISRDMIDKKADEEIVTFEKSELEEISGFLGVVLNSAIMMKLVNGSLLTLQAIKQNNLQLSIKPYIPLVELEYWLPCSP